MRRVLNQLQALWPVLVLGVFGSIDLQGRDSAYFRIQVIDEETRRGVPLVELTTTANHHFVTDSHGVVAFGEPGLMDKEVFFHVRSHGYRLPKDGFGFEGKMFRIVAGGEGVIALQRLNVAQRLYRITGYGIYRDTVLLGQRAPIRKPLCNGLVAGSDSVQTAVYQGKLRWFWGDTNYPRYPLGNFQVPGAVSDLPGNGGLDPRVGVNLEYLLNADGSAAETARMGDRGFTWMSGLVAFPDATGRERMFAHFVRGLPDEQTLWRIIDRGVMEWVGEKRRFRRVATWSLEGPFPDGAHAFIHEGFVYFADPFPRWRVPLEAERILDQASYESYSCLRPGSRSRQQAFDADAGGEVRFAWKRNTETLSYREGHRLIEAGTLAKATYPWRVVDAESGEDLIPHRGSIAWNVYRNRWVMIFGAAKDLGSIYYSESKQLSGPWQPARQVVGHDRYSFYNPVHHSVLDQEGGRLLFFEGTYSQSFSDAPVKTPLYDYNQIMYLLDLDDPRLGLNGQE